LNLFERLEAKCFVEVLSIQVSVTFKGTSNNTRFRLS
jgi:hypothetical protein